MDAGHRRELDLALELPGDELGAVASAEQMDEILDLIAGHVQEHRTTLVFVNTRRMAERVAHQLGERLGEGQVAAHHGSLSKDRRQRVESRLRSGDLRALVATASLELGIDIGPVELVCQIGSPRSFATFLQRVGRSNHTRGGIPAGRLYPTSRDELVECAALLRGARAGRLDALQVPACPLDILAQQVVAECAAEDWAEDDLLALARRAAPFADLSARGLRRRRRPGLRRDPDRPRPPGGLPAPGPGRRRLTGRRGARLAALTSGGAIPELGDYRVLAEPDDDPRRDGQRGLGDRVHGRRRVPARHDLVADPPGRAGRGAGGRCPGRAAVRPVLARRGPGPHGRAVGGGLRHPEGGGAAADLRSASRDRAGDAAAWLRAECGIDEDAADTIIGVPGAPGWPSSGCSPTWTPSCWNGSSTRAAACSWSGTRRSAARLNRALGLALRKRFCVTFDFELQAAASDDAILLSLGPQHSFPLDQVPRFLASKTVRERGPAGGAHLARCSRRGGGGT